MSYDLDTSTDLEQTTTPERQRPAVIHRVMSEWADQPTHPALCGFIVRPSNCVPMPQARAEQSEPCNDCEIILMELDLAYDD